ncbi:FxsB family cyclophane-forming radical SAM/SPASM peptide maturase [Sorangium sp. So ce1128]
MISRENPSIIPFRTFLWKIASRCNLNCSYCYVYNLADSSWKQQPGLMSEQTARQAAVRMREHLTQHGQTSASLVFHGGEPLLGGAEHIDRLAAIVDEELRSAGIKISLGIQSNLLLFDDAVGDVLLKNKISIGVSIDGPPAVNDRVRVDHLGRGTGQRLEQKLALLTSARHRSTFSGFLCVIDPETDPIALMDYVFSFDPPSVDFLFPLDHHDRLPKGKRAGGDEAPYGDWFIRLFDHWRVKNSPIRIRFFNAIIGLVCGSTSPVESLGLNPVDLIVVETDGTLEGVDSLKGTFEGAARLGYNIFDHDFNTVASHVAVLSRQNGTDGLCATCRACGVVQICGGGYIPHRYSSSRRFDNPSVYCADLKKVIRHIHAATVKELDPVIMRLRARSRGHEVDAGAETLKGV